MSPRLKHLLLATVEDPYDRKSWSGIPFSLRTALERKVEQLSVFTPSRPSRNPLDVARRLWHGGTPPKYPLWMTPATLKKNARELAAEIVRTGPDGVLSISSQCVAFLGEVKPPVFLFSDAPWLAWHQAYEGTVSAPVRMNWFAEQEARAARDLDGLCFGSAWAVAEAHRLYASPSATVTGPPLSERFHVTPLGANWVPGISREQVVVAIDSRPQDRLELLFVGKDWERKGGPLAVAVAAGLRAAGEKAHLHVVGCRPTLPAGASEFTTVHGPLYQSDAKESAALSELFLRSHFLLVPTLAECFGIVFAEAQAFGLPPVSRAVHALPTVVEDGVTGLLMEVADDADAYVKRILALRANTPRYRQMALSARDRFESTLNWDSTAEKILGHMEASPERLSR